MKIALLAVLCASSILACGDAAETEPSGTHTSSSSTTTGGGAGGTGGTGGGHGGGGATGSGGSDPDPVDEAIADFFEAFETEQYDRAKDLATELDAVAESAPERADVQLLRGHARLWRLAEWGRDPSQDPSEIPGIAFGAQGAFETARALAPEDHRILGWLGPMKIAIGRATSNDALVAEGLSDVDDGVAAYPEFNLFVRALVRANDPRDSSTFAEGVEAMWQTLDVCVGEPVDRDALDFAQYMHLETASGEKRVCWNDAKAHHNFEGFFLYFGDMLVKAGDVDAATAAYESAQLSSTYASWPYRGALEARISDASTRAALFADADPTNDPEFVAAGAQQCAACHAR